MQAEDFKELAAALTHTARSAGQLILRYRGTDSEVSIKGDGSPVTVADRATEEMIINDLARIAPGIMVIGEESAGVMPEGFNQDDPFFLVDPLDGTRDFVKGGKEFSINIALIEKRAPVFGLIYAPALQILYVTLGADNAVCAKLVPERGESLDTLSHKPLKTRDPSPSALKVLLSKSHLNDDTENFVSKLPGAEKTQLGSSLKFAVLADGGADLYARIAPTFEWDTAAGHAILNAAGGAVLTTDGKPLTYGKRETQLMNPAFVAWGKERTRAIMQQN